MSMAIPFTEMILVVVAIIPDWIIIAAATGYTSFCLDIGIDFDGVRLMRGRLHYR